MKKNKSPELKKRIAIEALKENKTVREIASEYEVHPSQVCKWKKDLCENALELFSGLIKKKKFRKRFFKKRSELLRKNWKLNCRT